MTNDEFGNLKSLFPRSIPMATNAKNCPGQKKLTREKPPTPPPQPVPVFTPIPCSRDQRVYRLHLEKHTQRWIAAKLKCAQPTVLRGIRRMEKWLATTLPEDRGEYTATEKLRLALAKHERLMEVLLKVSLSEFRRSRQTIPMRKTITPKDGVDEKGEPVKIRIEEWNKTQIGRKGFIDAAAKASHEITVLAAGWLGPGNGSISCAEVMDPEERDRWERMVTIREARIEELLQRVADLEGSHRAPVLGAGWRAPPSGLTAGLPAGGERGDLRSGVAAGSETRAEHRPATRAEHSVPRKPQASLAPVSRVAENNPVLYQESVKKVSVTSTQQAACVPAPDTQSPHHVDPQNLYQLVPRLPPENGPTRGSASTVDDATRAEPSAGEETRQSLGEVRTQAEPGHEEQKPARRLILESHDTACVPLKESELLELEKDGLAWLSEVGELIATLTPTNEYDTPYRQHLVTLWRNSERNYRRHNIIPERQKLPRLEAVRKGRPYMITIPPDRDKFSKG